MRVDYPHPRYFVRILRLVRLVLMPPCRSIPGVCLVTKYVGRYVCYEFTVFLTVCDITPSSAPSWIPTATYNVITPISQCRSCGAPWFVSAFETDIGGTQFHCHSSKCFHW
jgi:hypothetical protein